MTFSWLDFIRIDLKPYFQDLNYLKFILIDIRHCFFKNFFFEKWPFTFIFHGYLHITRIDLKTFSSHDFFKSWFFTQDKSQAMTFSKTFTFTELKITRIDLKPWLFSMPSSLSKTVGTWLSMVHAQTIYPRSWDQEYIQSVPRYSTYLYKNTFQEYAFWYLRNDFTNDLTT